MAWRIGLVTLNNMKKIHILSFLCSVTVLTSRGATVQPGGSVTRAGVSNALSGNFLSKTNASGYGSFTWYGGNFDLGPYALLNKDIANIGVAGSPTNGVNGTFSYASNILDGNGLTTFYTNGGSYTLRINSGSVFDDVVEIVTNNAPYPPGGVGQGVFTAHDPVRTGISVSLWAYSGSGSTVVGMTSSYLTNQAGNVNTIFQTNFSDTTSWLVARLPMARIPTNPAFTTMTVSGAATLSGSATVGTLTANGIGLTNVPLVTSLTVPPGAWFTNNVADGATLTAASSQNLTNTGDNFVFTDAITNTINGRFALPWDWDASTVRVGIRFFCSGSNSVTTTNVVWGVRATAIGNGDRENVLTWGTLVTVTNGVGTNSWTGNQAITGDVTVGNTPTTAKTILWQIQRLGAHTADTLTNSSLAIADVRIYYKALSITNFPVASP